MAGMWQINYPAPQSYSGLGDIFAAAASHKQRKAEHEMALEEKKIRLEALRASLEESKHKAAQDAQNRENDKQDATANWARMAGQALQQSGNDPRYVEMFRKQNEAMVKAGRMLPIDVTDPEAMQLMGAGNLAMQGKIEAPKPMYSPDTIDVANRMHSSDPGSALVNPGYDEMRARIDAEKLSHAKAAASQISINGKEIPAATVSTMSEAAPAMAAVDDLFQSFRADVPSGGTVDELGARAQSYIPNSPVRQYENKANMATQVVGKFLEGGVLKEQDFARYKEKFMPQAGDSIETAQKKRDDLIKLIQRKDAQNRKELGAAGYRVPKATVPQSDAMSRAQELKAQGKTPAEARSILVNEGYIQ